MPESSRNVDVDFPESTFNNAETSTLMFNNPDVILIATNSGVDRVAGAPEPVMKRKRKRNRERKQKKTQRNGGIR